MKPINKLVTFNGITFGITWSIWWLLAYLTQAGIMEYGKPLFMACFILGGFGPTIAPFLTLVIEGKKGSFKEYAKRLFKWKVNVLYYLFFIILQLSVLFLSISIGSLFSDSVTVIEALKGIGPLYLLILYFPVMIIGGGLEELGWRGIALAELEKKWNSFTASLILAFIWTLWHLPLFFIKGTSQFGTSILLFGLKILGTTFILTWLYNRTKSILLCVFYHAFYNALFNISLSKEVSSPDHVDLISAILQLLIGLLLVLCFSKAKDPEEKPSLHT